MEMAEAAVDPIVGVAAGDIVARVQHHLAQQGRGKRPVGTDGGYGIGGGAGAGLQGRNGQSSVGGGGIGDTGKLRVLGALDVLDGGQATGGGEIVNEHDSLAVDQGIDAVRQGHAPQVVSDVGVLAGCTDPGFSSARDVDFP